MLVHMTYITISNVLHILYTSKVHLVHGT